MLRTRLSNHMEAFLVEKQRFIISIQQCELLLSNRLMWQSEVKRTGYNGKEDGQWYGCGAGTVICVSVVYMKPNKLNQCVSLPKTGL